MQPFRSLVAIVLLAASFSGCTQDATPKVDDSGLDPQTGELYIVGVVLDDTLLPVVGVKVVVREGDLNATTDAGGQFQIGPVVGGSYSLILTRFGYEEALVKVSLPMEEPIRVILTAVAGDAPYYETFPFVGYYDCMIAAAYPTGNPTWPCIGIIDLATGTQVARDTWIFPFTVEAPGFKGVLAELVWEVQPTARWMSVSIRDAEGYDETGAQSYFYNRSLPNLHAWAYAGQENPGGDAPFYPEPNATATYAFTTSSATQPGAAVDFQFWLAHRSTLYATFFYHQLAEPEFSVLPDE